VRPWLLLLSLLLLLANGFFVAMEFALIAARRSQIEALSAEGNRRATVALRSIRELSVMLAGAQLGITMASLALGAVAEPAFADLFEKTVGDAVEIPSGLLHTISFLVALGVVVFLHMVIGEMAPKNIAIARPEASALWMAYPIRIYAAIFRPVTVALNAFANRCLSLIGIDPRDELLTVHSAREIGLMVSRSAREGKLQEFESGLLTRAAGFSERDAGEVMVPRTDMVALPLDVTPAEIENTVNELGHTRLPIYAGDLDRIVGFFHSKDLLQVPEGERKKRIPRRLIRPILVVPESRKLHPLLFDMRRERRHFALVVDEHGGTAGVVTLEDVLEELVGDILDEHDVLEAGVEKIAENRFLAPGSLRIDEAESRLGVKLPEGPYETVAGFLMDRLGRVPQRLDVVTHDGTTIRVRSMHRRRVVEVLIERAPAPTEGDRET
jgi:CBS domain containing-hemolysin-like protein